MFSIPVSKDHVLRGLQISVNLASMIVFEFGDDIAELVFLIRSEKLNNFAKFHSRIFNSFF